MVIVTAYATVDTAISAIKEGAQEYMVKPCNPEEISVFVQRVIRVKTLEKENVYLRRKLSGRWSFQDIISKSPRMQSIFELIREVASQRSTVLIQGASGTGKELVARALHDAGGRAQRPFVGISCAALAETLLESELFGHERGSFTGAVARKQGKLELAGDGTIFLDEIGDIPPKLQLDLLRVLQERRFFRVGGTEEIRMEARIIAATNRDLLAAVESGVFREDLYYRLNVINIQLPPLRERREDIPLLVDHFLARAGHRDRQAGAGHRPRRPEPSSWTTTGPATCASWRTPSSARWSRPGARSSRRRDFAFMARTIRNGAPGRSGRCPVPGRPGTAGGAGGHRPDRGQHQGGGVPAGHRPVDPVRQDPQVRDRPLTRGQGCEQDPAPDGVPVGVGAGGHQVAHGHAAVGQRRRRAGRGQGAAAATPAPAASRPRRRGRTAGGPAAPRRPA